MAKDKSQNIVTRIDPDRNAPSEGPGRKEIAQRAYEIYVGRGGADGSEQEDWLQAERELREQNASRIKADRL